MIREKICRILGKEGNITIPYMMRFHIGFQPGDVVSFQQVTEDAVLVRRERLQERKDPPKDLLELREYIDSMSESQQRIARCYLSILCTDDKHGGKE
jgi:bifunctional DNA-binding transcriptional regulator/antitoxin component of YhaV-PrlF toxin-antitoxin module